MSLTDLKGEWQSFYKYICMHAYKSRHVCVCVNVDTYLRRKTLKLWSKQGNKYPGCLTNLCDFVPFGTKAATNQLLNSHTAQVCLWIHVQIFLGLEAIQCRATLLNHILRSNYTSMTHPTRLFWQAEIEVNLSPSAGMHRGIPKQDSYKIGFSRTKSCKLPISSQSQSRTRISVSLFCAEWRFLFKTAVRRGWVARLHTLLSDSFVLQPSTFAFISFGKLGNWTYFHWKLLQSMGL